MPKHIYPAARLAGMETGKAPAAAAPTREEAAAWAIACLSRRSQHGQLCPVWQHRATVDQCNCWILPRAQYEARAALNAAAAWLDAMAAWGSQ